MTFFFFICLFFFFCLCMCLSACSEFWVLFVFGFAVWFLGCFGLVGCAKITDGQLDFACGLVISDWRMFFCGRRVNWGIRLSVRSMGGKRSAVKYNNLKIYAQLLLWFVLIYAAQVSRGETTPSDGKGFCFLGMQLQHYDSVVCLVAEKNVVNWMEIKD